MTPELQRAMADYEEARFQYRKALLASMDGTSDGQAIRQAIRAVQSARAKLRRLQASPPSVRPAPEPRAPSSGESHPGWTFFSRLLKAS